MQRKRLRHCLEIRRAHISAQQASNSKSECRELHVGPCGECRVDKVLNLSHSEEDLADRSSDLVEGKSQDFENKKIRRRGRNKLCALVPRLSTG